LRCGDHCSAANHWPPAPTSPDGTLDSCSRSATRAACSARLSITFC